MNKLKKIIQISVGQSPIVTLLVNFIAFSTIINFSDKTPTNHSLTGTNPNAIDFQLQLIETCSYHQYWECISKLYSFIKSLKWIFFHELYTPRTIEILCVINQYFFFIKLKTMLYRCCKSEANVKQMFVSVYFFLIQRFPRLFLFIASLKKT